VNRAERLANRGDRIEPPTDGLRDRLQAAEGAVTRAVVLWFQQTGNKPSDCTVAQTVSASATQLTLTVTVTKP
jgi:hypothetical protein